MRATLDKKKGTKMVDKLLKKIEVGRRHWNYVLNGERNASKSLAERIEKHTGIPKEVFVFGSAKKRAAAWKKYTKAVSPNRR